MDAPRSLWILSLIAIPALVAHGGWPSSTRLPEDALGQADGLFYGRLEVSNVVVHSQAHLSADGLIRILQPVFGNVSSGSRDIGSHDFAFGLSGPGGGGPWSYLGQLIRGGDREFPIVVAYQQSTDGWQPIWVRTAKNADALPTAPDLLELRNLSRQKVGDELTKRLMDAASDPRQSNLIWKYALRRLGIIEDDLVERFNMVFSGQLQRLGDGGRLIYARGLLLSNNDSVAVQVQPAATEVEPQPKPYLRWTRGGPIDGRVIRMKFLEAAEHAPNATVAEIAMSAVVEQAEATQVDWTDAERDMIHDRIEGVFLNDEHPLQSVSRDKRDALWTMLQQQLDR